MWRRWEPHVHVPGTLFEDAFASATVEQALDALAACSPAIEAVGITDYFTTNSFRRAQDAWKADAGHGIAYLFPNVELRLNDATARGNGVNLHVLSGAEDVDLLDDLLSRLTFSYLDMDYPASEAGLVSLGRAYCGDARLDLPAARREGARQFKVSFEQVKGLFQRDVRFRDGCLVVVAAGADGTSGMQAKDGGFAAYRQALERFSHAIFSGNPKDREFWLGRGSRSTIEIGADYGSLKACLHGSDAHEFGRLGKPEGNRFTWLKGDAHFNTLRQACIAPERRAFVGAVDPADGEHGRINAVSINDDSWFTPGRVPISTGLVAVIGARGSGKTALADLIAVGAGSSQPFENDAAFVHRAGPLLRGSEVTVGWYDDDDTTYPLSNQGEWPSAPRRVRYLSQQFVERLCSSDGVRPELLQEIERVIFEAWPIEHRQGATTFAELLNIRLRSARAAQQEELAALTLLSEKITDERVKRGGLAGRREKRATVAQGIATLESQIRELTGRADSSSGERHSAVSAVLAARQQELQRVDRRRTDLKSLHDAASTAHASHFPAFLRRLQDTHANAGLTPEQWQEFLPMFRGDVGAAIASALSAAELQYDEQ